MSNIDSIVNVQISIEAPMNPSASFSALLLVVPKAENAGSVTIPTVAEISSASDLADYGYTEKSEAYKAALVAFAQDPRPEKVYVTVRQAGDSDATNEPIATTLERAASENGWYAILLSDHPNHGIVCHGGKLLCGRKRKAHLRNIAVFSALAGAVVPIQNTGRLLGWNDDFL